jgi:glycosyltransferase involved in cell wall biosynthesis
MTYKAGIEAKKASGKPLVIHVHATEFDRTGGNGVNQHVYNIEKHGMERADRIITVSQFTKDKVMHHYGIDPNKIDVVHNAVEFTDYDFSNEEFKIKEQDKVVLFLGRITLQKGPDYFVYAAKKCLEVDPNIKFIVAGSGDMERFMIEKAAELGIGDKMLFMGFLRGRDIDRAYRMADVYVMPSVSEPFGITPLEAMRNQTPVIISKQSGVSEVINHCLKVDFWDIDKMANQILGLLHYKECHEELRYHGSREVRKFDWNIPAQKCIDIYNKVKGG